MFNNSLPNAAVGNGTVAKIILAAATLLTAVSLIPLAFAQEPSIEGQGEGKIVPDKGQSLDPSCISFSTITGTFAEFNCEGEQGFFGTIDSFNTNGRSFSIQGTIEDSTSTVTIKGKCDPENAKITFTLDDGSFKAIHKGQVTCTA